MVIKELANIWKGLVIINGRPRHPQSQGCVERGNGDLQIKLGKWMEDNTDSWSKGLKFVIYSINTSISATTGKTPYEIVFGQSARCHLSKLEELASQDLLDESELDDIVETEIIIKEVPEIHSEPNSGARPCNSSKLGCSSIISLLFNRGSMVAKGIQITNRSVIHGNKFNVDTHATFQLTEVADTNYIPEDDNPFEEPLNVGQYALWKLEDVIPEESNTPHGIIRTSARDKYLSI